MLIIAALSWLGLEIISNTAADSLALDRPEAALAWIGNHATALVELGQRQLASGAGEAGPNAVAELAQRALRSDPLQEGAWRIMAFAAEARGDMHEAETLMRLATSRSPRDLGAQAWLFNQRLLARDYATALTHVDAILRVRPDSAETVFPSLIALASDPDGRDPLVRILKPGPPWRSRFLDQLAQDSSGPAALFGIYAALEAAPHPLTTAEFRPYLKRLVDGGDVELAYAMQVDFLPTDRLAMLGHLNNGSFDFPISGLPFDWTIASVPGARSEVVVDDTANLALRVEFQGARVPYQHVWQTLLLRPGTYRLAGKVKAVDLQNERGLQWVITCIGGPQLVATDRVNGTQPWTEFETAFAVPNGQDCPAQDIRLVLPARLPAEQMAVGEIGYDDLRIERMRRQPLPPGRVP